MSLSEKKENYSYSGNILLILILITDIKLEFHMEGGERKRVSKSFTTGIKSKRLACLSKDFSYQEAYSKNFWKARGGKCLSVDRKKLSCLHLLSELKYWKAQAGRKEGRNADHAG